LSAVSWVNYVEIGIAQKDKASPDLAKTQRQWPRQEYRPPVVGAENSASGRIDLHAESRNSLESSLLCPENCATIRTAPARCERRSREIASHEIAKPPVPWGKAARIPAEAREKRSIAWRHRSSDIGRPKASLDSCHGVGVPGDNPMPFATVAVPFDVYRELPSPQHRWLLICLARYADRDGRCWPSMRQLAKDARLSKSSVQRYLADLSRLECFSRSRRPGGRYVYQLAIEYRPGLHGRRTGVPTSSGPVPQKETQKAVPIKHQEISDDSGKWEARLRGWQKRRMWLEWWGPRPNQPGCWAPASAISVMIASVAATGSGAA